MGPMLNFAACRNDIGVIEEVRAPIEMGHLGPPPEHKFAGWFVRLSLMFACPVQPVRGPSSLATFTWELKHIAFFWSTV